MKTKKNNKYRQNCDPDNQPAISCTLLSRNLKSRLQFVYRQITIMSGVYELGRGLYEYTVVSRSRGVRYASLLSQPHEGCEIVEMNLNKPRSIRRWSPEERRAIVLESLDPSNTVSAVAKKHGVSSVSIYVWRRELSLDEPLMHPSSQGHETYPDVQSIHHAAVDDTKAVASAEPSANARYEERIQDLKRQLSQLKAELDSSRRQRALLLSVLSSIGAQLKLLTEMEEAVAIGQSAPRD